MMDHQDLHLRCHLLLARLSTTGGWQLTPEAMRRYAAAVAALVGEAPRSDEQLALMLGYYHHEHHIVEALRDAYHPNHSATWAAITAQVRRILVSRASGALLADHVYHLDDLVQEALLDVTRGLPHYRYQSRLQTWLFTVVSHCLHRAARSRGAQKRADAARTYSLEALIAAGDAPDTLAAPGPDAEAQLRVFGDLLATVLARSPDQRLAAVLQLWLVEELPLRHIGTRLQLSVGTVHALLGRALALLRTDAGVQAWAADKHDPATAPSHERPAAPADELI